jgi:retron-type reverse transcriptase
VQSEVWGSVHQEFIQKIARKILSNCFKFKSVRRIEVFQPIKRFLVIGNFKDRVVQQAVSMILEQIFESKFLRTSHGFIGDRGCHNVLKQIQYEWAGVSWFLEFNIYKHFDVINKRRLINILREYIDDLNFLGLISQLFKSGIVGWAMKTYLWSASVFKICVVWIGSLSHVLRVKTLN